MFTPGNESGSGSNLRERGRNNRPVISTTFNDANASEEPHQNVSPIESEDTSRSPPHSSSDDSRNTSRSSPGSSEKGFLDDAPADNYNTEDALIDSQEVYDSYSGRHLFSSELSAGGYTIKLKGVEPITLRDSLSLTLPEHGKRVEWLIDVHDVGNHIFDTAPWDQDYIEEAIEAGFYDGVRPLTFLESGSDIWRAHEYDNFPRVGGCTPPRVVDDRSGSLQVPVRYYSSPRPEDLIFGDEKLSRILFQQAAFKGNAQVPPSPRSLNQTPSHSGLIDDDGYKLDFVPSDLETPDIPGETVHEHGYVWRAPSVIGITCMGNFYENVRKPTLIRKSRGRIYVRRDPNVPGLARHHKGWDSPAPTPLSLVTDSEFRSTSMLNFKDLPFNRLLNDSYGRPIIPKASQFRKGSCLWLDLMCRRITDSISIYEQRRREKLHRGRQDKDPRQTSSSTQGAYDGDTTMDIDPVPLVEHFKLKSALSEFHVPAGLNRHDHRCCHLRYDLDGADILSSLDPQSQSSRAVGEPEDEATYRARANKYIKSQSGFSEKRSTPEAESQLERGRKRQRVADSSETSQANPISRVEITIADMPDHSLSPVFHQPRSHKELDRQASNHDSPQQRSAVTKSRSWLFKVMNCLCCIGKDTTTRLSHTTLEVLPPRQPLAMWFPTIYVPEPTWRPQSQAGGVPSTTNQNDPLLTSLLSNKEPSNENESDVLSDSDSLPIIYEETEPEDENDVHNSNDIEQQANTSISGLDVLFEKWRRVTKSFRTFLEISEVHDSLTVKPSTVPAEPNSKHESSNFDKCDLYLQLETRSMKGSRVGFGNSPMSIPDFIAKRNMDVSKTRRTGASGNCDWNVNETLPKRELTSYARKLLVRKKRMSATPRKIEACLPLDR